MTKAEIVEKVAAEIKISKAAAARTLAVVTDSITQAIRKGGKVTLIGFGTFSVSARKARIGRNPQTGKDVPFCAIVSHAILTTSPVSILSFVGFSR